MLTLLRKGNTGTEILSILDAIVRDDSSSSDNTQGDDVPWGMTDGVSLMWCLLCVPYVLFVRDIYSLFVNTSPRD